MTSLQIVKVDAREHHGTALIDNTDAVWVAVYLRWWDVATLLFWALAPVDRRAWATLTNTQGEKARIRVMRIATKHVRIRGVVQ